MFAAIGIGAYVAAVFHLVMHAFFKALLFLGSGSVIHGMEHGVLHTGDHNDPQDMFNMGGLRKKMPLTFWTFVIGGLALAGFPLVTAGFWSKDMIFAEAFGNSHWGVFITLALAALLTAFYTMRQITLTFLGEPRTESAHHAVESKWTMTLPLVVLAFFSITAGWSGIEHEFPLIGGILPNWMHDFVGGTLEEHPELLKFSFIPLLSPGCILGGLTLGDSLTTKSRWRCHPDETPGPVYTLLKINTILMSCMIGLLSVHRSGSQKLSYTFELIRRLMDSSIGLLTSLVIGHFLRTYIDKLIVVVSVTLSVKERSQPGVQSHYPDRRCSST
jgi:NADH-quinone oxidoreductase subunit L